MPITVLNEFSNTTKDSITSDLHSAHSRYVLYFRGNKAGVVSADVEISQGGLTTQTFESFIINEDATYYYFIVDFTKYLNTNLIMKVILILWR